jgi:hypothetical protein
MMASIFFMRGSSSPNVDPEHASHTIRHGASQTK